LEHAAAALSDYHATRTAKGTKVAFARENQGDRPSDPIQGLGAGVRDSEESCIRKAVGECGLNSGPVGLADATSEDEPATGTAFALM
jgi:hypothetical protein